jgi:hypothetical protein
MVAQNSIEAEYKALTNTTNKITWIKSVLFEFDFSLKQALIL